ncbi:hypothetical protein WSM22_25390 [Cytophagales bacterium WSM2-2]|nr:hypothetical protein WSM22_25390 [Cytophagales bacterium WSM2-2]
MSIKYFINSLLGLLFTTVASAQQPEEFNVSWMKAKYGAIAIYNGSKNSFTIKFFAGTFEPAPQENFVWVDGVLMQVSLAPFHTKTPTTQSLNIGSQKVFLNSWREFEKKWLEDQLKVASVTEKVEFTSINNKVFMEWVIDMPPGSSGSIIKQVYLVTICFDQMLIFNGPIQRPETETGTKNKLTQVATTLELNAGKLVDLDQMYRDLQK